MRTLRVCTALSICLALSSGGAFAEEAPRQVGQWRAGLNYIPLPTPRETTAPAGKIQVSEVFWYGCGHCYALDPVLEEWNEKKAPYIDFVRVPVIWGPFHQQHAKLFYTLHALKRPELHAAVFDAIHKEQNPLADRDEAKAREMHFAFLNRHGVTRDQFDAAYDSMIVTTNVRRAAEMTQTYQVASVPVIFVAGKYSTGISEAGGPHQLISLIDALAESEKNR